MDKENTPRSFALSCPVPIRDYPVVLAAHGGGGRLMRDLIRRMFVSAFDDEALGDLRALAGVSKFPVRIKCALLGWNCLEELTGPDEAANMSPPETV